MKHATTRNSRATTIALCLLLLTAATAFAQGTAFTHQGRLTDNGAAANGAYDLQFALFDALSAGTQQGATITRDDVPVTNGVFTVQLDFGAAVFTGAARWLEIRVRPGSGTGLDPFTLLTPRQPLNATPYAIRSQNAGTADNATNLGGVAASSYLRTNGNGSALTNLNATNITSGTLSNARLGVVPVANGGTGSATQNFVDTSSNQTIGGTKTFNLAPSMLGGIALRGSSVVLSPTANDFNHAIRYNSLINGIQFNAFDEFLWFNTRHDVNNMVLETDGDLRILGQYSSTSDARYKTNVQTFGSALDAVMRLRGVTFNWKPEHNHNPRPQIGFIAQEVESVLPELVSTDRDGFKSVSYANAVPVLVEAVKEQQTQLSAQQQELKHVKAENAALKARLDALQALVCAALPATCRP